MARITQSELKALFIYDTDTGRLFNRVARNSRSIEGSEAGNIEVDGYCRIRINGKSYAAHRLAWLLETGSWPVDFLDHINGNKSDNRIANLRECNNSENQANQRLHARNKSGFKGVRWHKVACKWLSQITYNGKSLHIGSFIDPSEAAAAYDMKAIELKGPFALTNKSMGLI